MASLGEVGVLAIVLPLVGYIATKLYTLQNDLLYLKGTRIKILNEIVSGIKVKYKKICLKQQLTNRQNQGLHGKW